MTMLRYLPAIAVVASTFLASLGFGQYAPPDPSGFQGLIVETYYVADENDAADQDGGGVLPAGSVVYRVYADLKPGYRVLTVGGFPGHPLNMSTSTAFFNNEDRGEAWGRNIPAQHLNKNTVAIDSWLALGSASTQHWGVLKSADPDGSVVGGANNDNGLLVNSVPVIGLPLTEADGLWSTGTAPPSITFVGEAPDLFDGGGSNSYSNDNFAWAILGDFAVPDTANRVLLGQFTTDGVLELCFNITVKLPADLVCDDPSCHEFMEFYWNLMPSDTANGGTAAQNKFSHPTLCFNSSAQVVDCEGQPGGTALPGSPCDDGIEETTNDVYANDCSCTGEDCEGVLGGTALPGQPCDDGDPLTGNDTWQSGCLCQGVVGIHENAGPASLSLFPNPTKEQTRLELYGLQGERVTYTVSDMLGQRVAGADLGIRSGDWSGMIDLAHVVPGVYVLEVRIGDSLRSGRIIRY
ncbi:MAG: T9SS type A sorting domain-containing protein [Flavobacteriales bacterium]|nr:T9SS type A sorting domain-containing protein [Flavobacteriales bacterium]